jgi:uncharacterized protein
MMHLLDVSALIALGYNHHEFHGRVTKWLNQLARSGIPQLATCSITELGFARILSQAEPYGVEVGRARELLLSLKRANGLHWTFLVDGVDISRLPKWVKHARLVTDGHLVELAKTNNASLATFDRRIPGAMLIP